MISRLVLFLCIGSFVSGTALGPLAGQDPLRGPIRAPKSPDFIKRPPICPMMTDNLSKIHVISIDTYPNVRLKYFKFIDWSVSLPVSSTVISKYCNEHSTQVMASALGVNDNSRTQFKNKIKVTYIPALNCFGSGYEPDLVSSLEETLGIAKNNSVHGINTVLVYSILGTYNTQKKIDIFNAIADVPKTFIVTVIGNNYQKNYCPLKILSNKNLFIIGGTTNGNKLLEMSNVGPCVSFYLPGIYRSVVNGATISGTSYAGPIYANLIIRYLIRNPDATRTQIYDYFKKLSVTVVDKDTVMSVFLKNNVCLLGP
jgi:hypothetical protein